MRENLHFLQLANGIGDIAQSLQFIMIWWVIRGKRYGTKMEMKQDQEGDFQKFEIALKIPWQCVMDLYSKSMANFGAFCAGYFWRVSNMLATVVIFSQPLNLLLSHTNIMVVLFESQLFYHVMILNKVFSFFGKKIKFAYL